MVHHILSLCARRDLWRRGLQLIATLSPKFQNKLPTAQTMTSLLQVTRHLPHIFWDYLRQAQTKQINLEDEACALVQCMCIMQSPDSWSKLYAQWVGEEVASRHFSLQTEASRREHQYRFVSRLRSCSSWDTALCLSAVERPKIRSGDLKEGGYATLIHLFHASMPPRALLALYQLHLGTTGATMYSEKLAGLP